MAKEKYIVEIDSYGTIRWFDFDNPNHCHRINGPAIEYTNGDKSWHINGKCHRIDGPATEDSNGDKEWWFNGKLHREDGPAIEHANDRYKEWWINGTKLTESEFKAKMNPSSYEGKVVEIDGKKYKLTEV